MKSATETKIPSTALSTPPRAEAVSASPPLKTSAVRFGLLCVSIAYLWFVLIRHLSIEWSVNEQYTFGWAVPFLSVYLLWKRFIAGWSTGAETPRRGASWDAYAIAAILCLYLPTRLVQEANPEWRAVSWALGLEVVGLTLLVARALLPRVRSAYPILFLLIAVPWPSFLEVPIVQGLTQANTTATVEILGWTGTPAFQRGNVIEISTGLVGIDEACSGIRSLQASLMIALFVGELYRLRPIKRVHLVISAFVFSFVFNVLRTWLLVTIASRTSPAAMVRTWHDPAGVAVLLACFASVWGLAYFLRRPTARQVSECGGPPPLSTLLAIDGISTSFINIAPVLAGWILCTEISVEAWYRAHERAAPPAESWSIKWPIRAASFQYVPMTLNERRLLRYDEAQNASWERDGLRWQAIALRWKPGRTAARLATGHTPEVCLTAAGRKPSSISAVKTFQINGLTIPFRRYDLEQEQTPLHVFYCLWNERDSRRVLNSTSMSYAARFTPVLHGERNTGQRSIEIAVWGAQTGADADTAFARELPRIIQVKG